MKVELQEPTREELETVPTWAVSVANSIIIDSPEMYQIAVEEVRDIKAKMKELDERRKAITTPLDQAKKKIMDLFRTPLDALAAAETKIKHAMVTYSEEKERERRAEQARLDAIAREERERLAKEAAALEKAGKPEEAEAAREIAAVISAPAAMIAEGADAAGVSYSERWSAEVDDLLALARFVVENPAHLNLISANPTQLDMMARAMKSGMNIPGVRAVCKKIASVRSA